MNVQHTPDEQPDNLFDLLDTIAARAAEQPDSIDQGATVAEQFERFHDANPAVYKTLRWLARDWDRRTSGRKIGFPALYERARWELGLRTDGDTWVLNNNWRPYYSRLLMAQEPDLAGKFETRRSPEADEWLPDYAARTGLTVANTLREAA
ncbi:hypothetical protein [Micromonospora sp. DT227]|uniref:hypothetical protein n=1 Tax=Micromonospora sp. DT227 TaxID=3393433 RepID=UPI003CF49A89